MFASHSLKVSVVKSILADGVVVTGVMPKNSKFPSLSVIISSTGARISLSNSAVILISSSHSISSSSLFEERFTLSKNDKQTSGNKSGSSTISITSFLKSSIKLSVISIISSESMSAVYVVGGEIVPSSAFGIDNSTLSMFKSTVLSSTINFIGKVS